MRATKQTILIATRFSGYQEREATVISPRVAVHQAYLGGGFMISDPLTGRAYLLVPKSSEQAALDLARRLVRKFGRNPLRGSILKGDEWKRKPHRYEELKEFLMITQR